MVINHLLTGMIIQVGGSFRFFRSYLGTDADSLKDTALHLKRAIEVQRNPNEENRVNQPCLDVPGS